MKRFLLFVLLVCSLAANTQTSQRKVNYVDFEPCKTENQVIQDGEEVTYKLYYQLSAAWLAAGEVTFRVKDKGDTWLITADGRTYSAYEWFFKVRDHYAAEIDKNTLLPIHSIRDISEGKYHMYERLTFNQTTKQVICERGPERSRINETNQYELNSCMHDILSSIAMMRNINMQSLKVGDRVPFTIFMDKEEYPLYMEYKGVEKNVKVRGNGRYNVRVFAPQVIAGEVFNANTEMLIYTSDDENRLPLLIESPVSVGKVKAVLKSAHNLRFDLTSKVK